MLRTWMAAALAALALAVPAMAAEPAAAPKAEPDFSWVDKLPRQTGDVAIAQAQAHLNLGDGYYFLGPAEAKRVLTEVWGNPPQAADNVLGMIFEAGHGPLDRDAWGAVVTYEDSGYVSDADAAKIDAPKLLDDLRRNEDEINERRRKDGFAAMHLVGWAEPPSYDAASHSAIWARDVRFSDQPADTLNYGIRVLGRRGVLSLNIVAPLTALPAVRQISTRVRDLAAYDMGSRYTDVDKGHDKMAAYGVAGLIAAGVGAAAAKKVGLIALLLAFGKKGFVLVAAGAAAALGWFRRPFGRLFGGRPKDPPPGAGGRDIVT
ncbi:MAG TPA: DUF2167 domain-containing protein [Caulobacteraceae bacterium]|nr:DUF2167 domain-containing protein [Caulobacteraceae bacterium]